MATRKETALSAVVRYQVTSAHIGGRKRGPCQGAIHIPTSFKKPPEITAQSKSYTAFPVDDFSLVCNASGNPSPAFRWIKDGKLFDPTSDPWLSTLNHSGTFTVTANGPISQYEGKYRCYASNELGTAVSKEIHLITENAPILPKDTKVKKKVEEGDSVILYYLRHIDLSERVTTGLDGSLYFAHATTNDSRDDYTCNAQYINARTILPKEAIPLTVTTSNSVVKNREPRLLQPPGTSSSYLALRGRSLVLECIPEGLPTPTVQWDRKDRTLSTSHTSKQNFDRWLRFNNITETDDGEYECTATNALGVVTHKYTVSVEAAPYWTKQPESQLYAPGETVRLYCEANGFPTPNVIWSMNGNPISGIDQDIRRRVHGGNLILKDVEFSDTAVYQCEASNKHGTILVNTYIHVIKLPPQILTEDRQTYQVTEGQTADLKCNTFGSPRPTVTWESLSWDSVLSNNRMSLLTSGVLQINNTSLEDSGLYTCSVVNSNLSINAQLEVLNRSVILPLPESQRIRRGNTANITCHALIDPQLHIQQRQWRKARQKLMESTEYIFDGPSLIIPNVQFEDEGKYTCEVMTKLDMANATVSITVVDRPDQPQHLQLMDHQERSLTLRWSPGDHHNSPILAFIVELEEQRFGKGKWVKEAQVEGHIHHVEIHLQPFCIYSFRVKAVNELGESDYTPPTKPHKMPAAAPTGNPDDVQSNSTEPDALVITWKLMDSLNFNGPDFKYRVMWRQADNGQHSGRWQHRDVKSPPFIINNTGTFKPFLIKVQAVNEKGAGPPPPEVIGYSGEDEPQAAPTKVHVEHLNSSAVRVKWVAVGKETVQGHLLGYKIHLRWLGSRTEREREREQEDKEFEVSGAKEEEVLGDLRPYSHYSVNVTAFNSKGEGPHSDPHVFSTPEGTPGPPVSLTFDSPTETELTLHWEAPTQVNGVLIGYLLQYQEIVYSNGKLQGEEIADPEVSHFNLGQLNPHSLYRFYLRGRTSAGEGPAIMKEAATLLDGVPPSNISMAIGERYVNLSWVPGERHRNVEFQITYLKKNAGNSLEKADMVNSTQSFHRIDKLDPGSQYSLHIFYSNKTHWSTEIKTEGPGLSEVQGGFATQGWFIGLISAIVLLLLVLLILCFIKRSKGGKYSVKDKEEGQVDSEARPMKDETFGEYSENEEKRSASQPSLCVESKLGSEDSLAEYGDSVDIQFNEDGSFIGQYSGHRDGPGPGGPDSSGATSPVNPAAMAPTNVGLPNSVTGIMSRGN
ncbi:hypothetical protein AAFF_G00392270 [Aldrovandia affinis]|uniref:Neural cell adhesion molecule L1 n=1 Tax=Aldrovandia affinis TaxID=143900 RepID=A0AAD7WL76_9TELE|nr:hypothetical protein AAFF_G00392270 [Aldrovandia affinis]